MDDNQTTKLPLRIFLYCLGLVVLCTGLTLNTKTGLGAAAIASVPYTISVIWPITYGTATVVFYTILVLVQLFLLRKRAGIKDVLQLPMSVAQGMLLNALGAQLVFPVEGVAMKIIVQALGIICTGVGASTILNMSLVPSPADGFVQTISDVSGKQRGTCKNICDASCAALSFVLAIAFTGSIVGIGLGTVAAVLFTGRVMAIFDRMFQVKMCAAVGVDPLGRLAKK